MYLNLESEQQDKMVKMIMRAMPKSCIRETNKHELLHPTLRGGGKMRSKPNRLIFDDVCPHYPRDHANLSYAAPPPTAPRKLPMFSAVIHREVIIATCSSLVKCNVSTRKFQADLIHSDTLSSCFSHKGESGDETSRHSKTMQCSTHTDLEDGK